MVTGASLSPHEYLTTAGEQIFFLFSRGQNQFRQSYPIAPPPPPSTPPHTPESVSIPLSLFHFLQINPFGAFQTFVICFFFNKISLGKTFICKLKDWMSNSVDPDETSHLDLYCLQKPIIIACGKERVKAKEIITSLRFLLDLCLFLIVTRTFIFERSPKMESDLFFL